jgi:hypothetical protein
MLDLVVSLSLFDGEQVIMPLLNLRGFFSQLLGGVTVVQHAASAGQLL